MRRIIRLLAALFRKAQRKGGDIWRYRVELWRQIVTLRRYVVALFRRLRLWLARLTLRLISQLRRRREMRGIPWWALLLLTGGLFAGFLVIIVLIEGFSVTVIIILALLLLFVLLGLKQVKEEERWVIELFGKYCWTLKPGLKWIFPWIMKVRAIVSIWELTLPLFEEPIKIDFKDGSATPKGAEVFVKLKNPDIPYSAGDKKEETGTYRSVYEIADWIVAAKNLIENALRSFLNGLTIDEAISMARAGYDLVSPRGDVGLPNHEIARIKRALAQWGFELKRITITDFDLEPELVKARGEVQIRQREAEASAYLARGRANETIGTVIESMAKSRGKSPKEIQRLIERDPELQREFINMAKDLITRSMAIDGKSFVDIRVDGANGVETTLLDLLAAWKRMPTGGGLSEGPSGSPSGSVAETAPGEEQKPSKAHEDVWRRIKEKKSRVKEKEKK